MNGINNKTVSVSTSDELKDILKDNNGYKYIYLENDINLINANKNGLTINDSYQMMVVFFESFNFKNVYLVFYHVLK